MDRLARAIDNIRHSGYTVNSAVKLNGGINSNVYKIICNDGDKYALKLYPAPTKSDIRNRYLTEKKFLEYVYKCGARNVPLIRESSLEENWCLLSWIDGQEIYRLEKKDFKRIAKFIQKINQTHDLREAAELNVASDACISLNQMIESISLKIQDMKKIKPNTIDAYEMKNWIIEQLEPKFLRDIKTLLDKTQLSHWECIEKEKIASPSDMGIHNMLRRAEEIVFYDFEYAGLDDLSKLTADLIMQPKHTLEPRDEDELIENMLSEMKNIVHESWVDRLKDIKPIIHTKWCLIMLRELNGDKFKAKQASKVKNYFKSY